MTKIFCLFFLIVLALKAEGQSPNYCIANRFSETAFFDSSDIRIDTDIVFATSKNYFTNVTTTLKMDVYYPDMSTDSLSSRPFIMLIHGGAFLAGSRKEMNYMCMEFARRGFVTATMDYRLGWNCSGTDFFSVCVACGNLNANLKTATYCAVQDAKAAMRYIHSNAQAYSIDTSYLFIGGESAGSITALHTAFWRQSEANTFVPAAVSQVGLLDTAGNKLTDTYNIKGVVNSCGAVTKDSILLNKGNIPVISFADEYDCVVPPAYGQVISCFCTSFYYDAGSAAIYNMLTKNGICSEYHQVPANLGHCSFPKPQLVWNASCFIKRVMCNTCQSSFSSQPNAPVSCSQLSGIDDNRKLITGLVFTFTNPVKDDLILSFNADNRKPLEIIITDMPGRIVTRVEGVSRNTIHIGTQNLKPGLYSISVSDGEKYINKKLVIVSDN